MLDYREEKEYETLITYLQIFIKHSNKGVEN
jgi:hypothetical protein